VTEDEIKGVQCFAFLAELMLDDEIGAEVRERAKGYPQPEETLDKIRNEAKAEAMDSLLEYGYPMRDDHAGTRDFFRGQDVADEWWREEFALRARVYRGEEEYR
jgi:hypothetical protein